MIHIEVNYGTLTGSQRIPKSRIGRLYQEVERLLRLKGDKHVSVAFIEETSMRHLNETYYGGKGVTDVLAFPSEEDPGLAGYLGEVLIYYPRAKKQAREHKTTVRAEVELLLVHGMLHLLGYDHDTPPKKANMFRVQDKTLKNAQS